MSISRAKVLINPLLKSPRNQKQFLGHLENLSLASFGPLLDGKFHVFIRAPESHNDRPLYSIMGQLNPGNIFTTFVFKYRLYTFSFLRLVIPRGSYVSRFPATISYIYFSPPRKCYMFHPSFCLSSLRLKS